MALYMTYIVAIHVHVHYPGLLLHTELMVSLFISVECRGFESHPRQLIFLRNSDCLGCAVLLCLVCLTLLASFFLPSHLSLKHVHIINPSITQRYLSRYGVMGYRWTCKSSPVTLYGAHYSRYIHVYTPLYIPCMSVWEGVGYITDRMPVMSCDVIMC